MNPPEAVHVSAAAPQVRHLRQVLLWPLRLMPLPLSSGHRQRPWELLKALGDASPWQEWHDEYTGSPDRFHERHYSEFVTFLPYVQHFLYGEPRRHGVSDGDSSMRVFRRLDVRAVRVTPRLNDAPLVLQVVHVNLCFFYDVDVVLLEMELRADDLGLRQAQDLIYRVGRAYPSGWEPNGQPLHSLAAVDWLGADGQVLASSDAQQRDAYLSYVAERRAPRIAAHWDFLLAPLVPDQAERDGPLRYRQIEYYRMPLMAYLALDEPQALRRADFVRLGLVTGAGSDAGDGLPYNDQHLDDFERRYCYDRFWSPGGPAPYTRYLCCGHALVVVGRADSEFFRCEQRGVLAQFRHQHLLLFLIAHFQKAALLMYSEQLVDALKKLDIRSAESVKSFKRTIRSNFESFLRFTHRYWFHTVAEQAQARALFQLCATHLDLDPLYADVKERIADMNAYLEADSLRRQANTVVRLTVVTIFGMIGTITTGFLGMNVLAAADDPLWQRVLFFVVVFVLSSLLTFYTMAKSKRLSDFLDAVTDERLRIGTKFGALFGVWRRQPPE